MFDDISDYLSFSPKEELYNSNIFKYKEFIINKDCFSYKIKILLDQGKIKLKSMNYELNLTKQDFSNLIDIEFKTTNDVIKFILNSFSLGNITIKEIIPNKIMKLNIILCEKGKNNNIELNLINNNMNKDFLINEICNEYENKFNYLEKENLNLKEELDKFKYEIERLKLKQINDEYTKNINKNKIIKEKNNEDFNNFRHSELTQNSYCSNYLNNTFSVFNSINNLLYIVYSTEDKSIISYNLIAQKINIEIKNAHKYFITNFRYYLDKKNKKDLILSLSDYDNNIKVWDCNIWECILNLENINLQGFLNSACFLNDNNILYIISSNWNYYDVEKIKVFNIKGEKIKEIDDSENKTVYITSFYDNIKLKNYIVTGNDGYIISYDYTKNVIYHKYQKKKTLNCYYCIIMKYFKNILYLIGSCFDGFIRTWDFHSGENLISIDSGNKGLIGICFWDDNYLFCGDSAKLLKIIDFQKRIVIKEFYGLKDFLCTLKKIEHPILGKCLISQGSSYEQIKLWRFMK